MARYSNAVYQGAYYGANFAQLAGSAAPVYSVATSYTSVVVTWVEPAGAGTEFIALKLLRNQDAYAETEEDGAVVWSWEAGDPSLLTKIEDGVQYTDIPLSSGRYVYYRMWLQKADSSWVPAGDSYTIVPYPHGTVLPDGGSLSTLDKIADFLPRVFTSSTQSPLDEVDNNSTLYNFLSAFSFTWDEILTLTSMLAPDASGRNVNPGLLLAQADQLGITQGSLDITKSQKKLVRDAIYTYSRKGTSTSFGTLAEDVTGFAPTITVSQNLMLSNQDSTFNNGVGSWIELGDCALSVANDIYPPTVEALAIDMNYTGKVVVATAGARLSNGESSPKTKGIPVTAGQRYFFSYYIKSVVEAVEPVTPSVTWYDFNGVEISDMDPPVVIPTVTTDWVKSGVSGVAPAAARYASMSIEFGEANTFYIDMISFDDVTGLVSSPPFEEARGVTLVLAPLSSEANPYPNKEVKLVRLIQEMYNNLPNNTPYRIELDGDDPVVGFTH
jgi:hypothetical protein